MNFVRPSDTRAKCAGCGARNFAKYCLLLAVATLISVACANPSSAAGSRQARVVQVTADTTGPGVLTTFPQIHSNLDGRIAEFVRTMHQDRLGHLWFGANVVGVVRYDGQALTHFGATAGFPGTAVRAIVEDDQGTLWFGTSDGLIRYDGIDFTTYSLGDAYFDNDLWSLYIDDEGLLWVGSNTGVRTFDGETFTAVPIPRPSVADAQPMLSEHRVSRMLQDRNGHYWFVTDGYGLVRFDGTHFHFLTEAEGLADNQVADLLEDQDGRLWIGSFYGGLSSLHNGTFTHYTQAGAIQGEEVYNLLEAADGSIWYSAENHGVYRFHNGSFTHYTTEDGLTTNTIQCIFEDDQQRVWFSSWQGLSVWVEGAIVDAATVLATNE